MTKKYKYKIIFADGPSQTFESEYPIKEFTKITPELDKALKEYDKKRKKYAASVLNSLRNREPK